MANAINPFDKINSITFYTNYGNDPCAYLRVRGPMRQLGIKIIDGIYNGIVYPDRVSQSDAVVIQRDFPRDQISYQKIWQLAHREKKPVIYDIDDLLLLMPEEHPERLSQHYVESILPMMQALYEADMITTTTPKLQDYLLQFNNNVKLLPNYFDDSLWSFRSPNLNRQEDKPLIIGYMGSESHGPDLSFIEPVLFELLKQYQERIYLNFWGIRPPKSLIDNPQVKWIPSVSYDYDDFTAFFQTQYADIFIAPLIDNQFNRSKSPLKFFEYSALGAPGVYSKLETFTQAITHEEDGLLASSEDEWQENIVRLIENPSTRLEIAYKAQKTIREKWLLSQNAYKWHKAYQTIELAGASRKISNRSSYKFTKSLNQQYTFLVKTKDNTIQTLRTELEEIRTSRLWRLFIRARQVWNKLVPPGSNREELAFSLYHWVKDRKLQLQKRKRKKQQDTLLGSDILIQNCHDIMPRNEVVDIIICVHNAYEDVYKCLNSVVTNTTEPFNLVIVDDGSDKITEKYLIDFSSNQANCTLIRNDCAHGYTKAANIGIKASKASLIVLLNSDTIVTAKWMDRLCRAINQGEKIGIAGPLSNTASWQSIPKLTENGDWAINDLPKGIAKTKMSDLVAKYSACIHPEVPLLNGFCMMIRKEVVEEIGFFDEVNFGQGYGEEDDFVIRANKAGWNVVIADDAYIYHAQSKSYTSQTRFALQKQSGEKLRKKHGTNTIAEKVGIMHDNRVMEGIRARSRVMLDREAYLEKGRSLFSNKRILFILPVRDAGGGANVILDEANCMHKMGVDVQIFNLKENKSAFNRNYPHIELPFIFGESKDLPSIASDFDAVVASANYSIPWLKAFNQLDQKPILGYYIQGFEPLMFSNDSLDYNNALKSYTAIEGIKRFTKTEWTRSTVLENTGVDSRIVGISVNIDLFRPRNMIPFRTNPVTIVAMIRPGSSYRNPEMTVKVLREIYHIYKKDVDIWFFGADDLREVVHENLLDFDWRQLGKLTQTQVASMMSKADIFTDFSSHQAMGLSALEAMAAGCTVVVPKYGGAVEFVNHNMNGKIANTNFMQSCIVTLEELIEDDTHRHKLQLQAINDVVEYYPEKVGYNILSTLFSS